MISSVTKNDLRTENKENIRPSAIALIFVEFLISNYFFFSLHFCSSSCLVIFSLIEFRVTVIFSHYIFFSFADYRNFPYRHVLLSLAKVTTSICLHLVLFLNAYSLYATRNPFLARDVFIIIIFFIDPIFLLGETNSITVNYTTL